VHRSCPSVCPSVCLSVCLFVCLSAKMKINAIFSKKNNFELWCLLTTYSLTGLFKESIIGSLQSKMAEIRHLENRHNVFFSAEDSPIWIKFRRLVKNDMSTAVMCGNGNQM